MAKVSPTQRSLKYWKEGSEFFVAKTEHWNGFAKVRQDLFNFIDIVVIRPGITGLLGIQTTSASNISARQKKIEALPSAKAWLEAGNQIIVEGWCKKGPRGKKKVWTRKAIAIIEIQ